MNNIAINLTNMLLFFVLGALLIGVRMSLGEASLSTPRMVVLLALAAALALAGLVGRFAPRNPLWPHTFWGIAAFAVILAFS